MTLPAGTRFGPYEVAEEIGAGGMGVVYRATDTNLKREVAIKVLPESLSTDKERLIRFQREAELLASLNHPNIAQIHGLEKVDGTTALVLELVEGATLEERIAQGPISVDEALAIAGQIAEALEGAHGQGIVHRDLKPANIKLRPDGTVKVLDFDIAKALEPENLTSEAPSPMLTTPATQVGVILGTAAYMSPEQARGKQVDQRADIWAFGCVLYEMLTGQPAFGGEDVTVTLARVVEREADLDSLPRTVKPAVRQTIRLCLQKDVKKRLQAIGDARLALSGAFESVSREAAVPASLPWWRRAMPALVTAAVALAVGGAVGSLWFAAESGSVSRFTYSVPVDHMFRRPGRPAVAVSPDGSSIAYNTQDGIYLRRLDDFEAQVVAGTEEDLSSPFYSPDGQSLGYWAATRQIKRISVNGGAPLVVADNAHNPYGVSWAHDGTIFYAQSEGIFRVPATAGTPQLVIPASESIRLFAPSLLPDGDSLLFAEARPGFGNSNAGRIVVQSLSTGERTVLVEGGADPRYVPTGHLLYSLQDVVFARAFDADTLSLSGGPVSLLQDVARAFVTGEAQLGFSDNGILAYAIAGNLENRSVVWVDRDGTEEPIPVPASRYNHVRISPDGRRVALDEAGAGNLLWIWDSESGTRILLGLGESGGDAPAWTPDGTRITYHTGTGSILDWHAANNTGSPERFATDPSRSSDPHPYFFISDTDLVFSGQSDADTGEDIGIVSLGANGDAVWLLRGPFDEGNAELSPDGRWLAYQSNESGQYEIYVRPFPNVEDDIITISNAGGLEPFWSRDGSELFYLEASEPPRLMSVAVQSSDANLLVGDRAPIMSWPYRMFGAVRSWDAADDGRFLAIKRGASETAAAQIAVVQNWFQELERFVPTD